MAQFESLKDRLVESGCALLYIAAEKRNGFFKPVLYLLRNPVSFPFLLDEDRRVTKAYGLYHRLGTDAFNIAHPATVVVDRSGVVQFIYLGENQTDRVPVERVFEFVKGLRS
jgi:alkyl hydroperoxide reductase subunit AhpC